MKREEFQRDCSVSGLLSIKQIAGAFSTDGVARTTRCRARSPSFLLLATCTHNPSFLFQIIVQYRGLVVPDDPVEGDML